VHRRARYSEYPRLELLLVRENDTDAASIRAYHAVEAGRVVDIWPDAARAGVELASLDTLERVGADPRAVRSSAYSNAVSPH